MTLARTLGVALVGVQGHLIEIEADLANGLPGLALIGLPDAALQESRDRVRAAVANSGEDWPNRRITVALSPATLPKRGSGFDLAVAVGILAAAGSLPVDACQRVVLLGELGLDGQVRAVRGVLPAVLAASAAGIERVVVPAANVAEAQLVPGMQVHPVGTLRGALAMLRGDPVDEPVTPPADAGDERPADPPDLSDVLGQAPGRRALEVAAAGAHHLFLVGSPGAGKTMLAERLPGLLPPLAHCAALEVSVVHSIAGVLPFGRPLVSAPPYRAPHHTATVPALVGGGSGLARPGEASLAHRGVLFLDEAPEFRGGVLDALREPMERGNITVARAAGSTTYPARFQLVLAANPCPCAPLTGLDVGCTCTPTVRRRYLGRLSGPLLDRVDLQVKLWPVSRADLLADVASVETSQVVAHRVAAARARAADHLRGTPWRTRAEIPGRELRDRFPPTPGARAAAEVALERGKLSARGIDRVLRVAWTLADLAERGQPGPAEVGEALGLRDVAQMAA